MNYWDTSNILRCFCYGCWPATRFNVFSSDDRFPTSRVVLGSPEEVVQGVHSFAYMLASFVLCQFSHVMS